MITKEVTYEKLSQLALALEAGTKFYTKNGSMEIDVSTCINDYISNTSTVFYVPAKWYENIPPKGVLCWVWDNDEDQEHLRIINYYDEGATDSYYFKSEHDYWKFAEPVKLSELEPYLLEGVAEEEAVEEEKEVDPKETLAEYLFTCTQYGYDYIARDKSGSIFAYNKEPVCQYGKIWGIPQGIGNANYKAVSVSEEILKLYQQHYPDWKKSLLTRGGK